VLYLEIAVAVAVIGLLAYGTILLVNQPRGEARVALPAGAWRVAHYEHEAATRVVVQKVTPGGSVVDEHLVATVPVDDIDYEERFLAAMATARERLALFEAEET
jgi:hypothetical protein